MAGNQGGIVCREGVAPEASPIIPNTTPDRCRPGPVHSDLMVPMRDGVQLATDLYLPDGEGAFPTILVRMPYGKTEPYCYMPLVADLLVRKGYALAVQDVRGKHGSEGVFTPDLSANEIPDGYDTVEWIVGQAWSDGRVGMLGESYFGYTCFAAACEAHPALKCIAPGNTTVDRYGGTYRNGALRLATLGMWAIGVDDRQYRDMSAVDPWTLPLADLGAAVGFECAYFDGVVRNPVPNAFWDEHGLPGAYDRITLPILHWGGWYDYDLGPLISDWQEWIDRQGERRRNHLLIGPWDHEGTADTIQRVGNLAIGPGTAARRWQIVQAFFDRYVMELDNGFGEGGRVQYFVMGGNAWRQCDAWPPPGVEQSVLYFHSGGSANTAAGDGALSAARPGEEPFDTFVYDPADPVTETFGIDCFAIAGQMRDRREIESRPDMLCYSGDPLAGDLEITGPVQARLCVASSAPDTDFTVALVDVSPDGSGNLIVESILRLSHREPASAPMSYEPGTILALDVDLWSTSYVVKTGHRLRVEVSSSAFDRYDRNLNTGEPFGAGERMATATQTVHHSAAYPSFISLSVMPRSKAQAG